MLGVKMHVNVFVVFNSYKIEVDNFSTDANWWVKDELAKSNGSKFSTHDKDNDEVHNHHCRILGHIFVKGNFHIMFLLSIRTKLSTVRQNHQYHFGKFITFYSYHSVMKSVWMILIY